MRRSGGAENRPFEPDSVSTDVVKFLCKNNSLRACCACCHAARAAVAEAVAAKADSASVVNLRNVEVVANRANDKTPVAFSNMDARRLPR